MLKFWTAHIFQTTWWTGFIFVVRTDIGPKFYSAISLLPCLPIALAAVQASSAVWWQLLFRVNICTYACMHCWHPHKDSKKMLNHSSREEMVSTKYFSYFYTKHYCGTHWNCLSKVLLMHTHNIYFMTKYQCFLVEKKKNLSGAMHNVFTIFT